MQFIQGKIRRTPKIVLYGTEGVGKTTMATGAPAPVFIDTDQGSENFDIPRFQCATWGDVMEAAAWLYHNEHEFKTLTLDTVTKTVEILQTYVATAEGVTSIADIPYGRGFVKMGEEFAALLRTFDALVLKGMSVVVLGHAVVERFNDPAGSDYDRWTMGLNKHVGPALKQWADAYLFADHDTSVTEVGEGFQKRKVARSWGSRIIWTEHRATHDAKNRFNLPEKLQLHADPSQTWSDLQGWIDHYYTT